MLRIVLVFFLFSGLIEAARILGVVPTPSYSHQVVFRPIWHELLKRGHDLVVMTTDPMKDVNYPNLKQIDWSPAYKIWKEDHNISHVLEENKYNLLRIFEAFNAMFTDISNFEIYHPEVQALLQNKSEHFDLVIVEFLYPTFFPLGWKFNCPYIGVTSLDMPLYSHEILGNPAHPVLYPDFMLPFEGEMNFLERLVNVLLSTFIQTLQWYDGFKDEQVLIEKYFGEDTPNIYDVIKNVSAVLLNVDPTFYKRPLGPNMIPIGGGTHLAEPKPLPVDLKEFLDSGKNGVVYLSLGTNVNETNVSPRMRKAFIDTFKKLPYKVLWKFGVQIADIPDNVKIVKWLNQQDVLRHPNVKCFITQGGLQSMEEAIFTNVPLIGIPFFGDQEMNVNKMAKKGLGVALNKDSMTEEILTKAIHEVINDKKYRQKMIEISKLSKDVQFTGLEKAIWWIEYVIRHKGAEHLRNKAMDVPLYQWFLLDVIAFFSILFFMSYKTLGFIYRKLSTKSTKPKVE